MEYHCTYLVILDWEQAETSSIVPENLFNFITLFSLIQLFDLRLIQRQLGQVRGVNSGRHGFMEYNRIESRVKSFYK
jgi:hypothetical protein